MKRERMCACDSLYIYEYIPLDVGVTFTVEHERALRGLRENTEVTSEDLELAVLCCSEGLLGTY